MDIKHSDMRQAGLLGIRRKKLYAMWSIVNHTNTETEFVGHDVDFGLVVAKV